MLTNKEILELNDGMHYGKQLYRDNRTAIWLNTDCNDGHLTVALFNLSEEDGERCVSFADLGLEQEDGSVPSELTLHELWDKTNHTVSDGVIRVDVPAHGVKVYKLI